jgi:alkanesulfonate monooxygenase SsuD/methylene tetrahydromethanopterin reductase-like flavin-dependent oxidoreductase (luciferase family)
MSNRKRMVLGAYVNPSGHHVASWRHPRAQADAHVSIDHYLEVARTLERSRFDLIFLADSNKVRVANMDALRRSTQFVAYFEPLTLLSALAMATTKLGLVATASTSWDQPFHIARKFASLDHVSKGRAGWNAVTSVADAEAQNFGYDVAYEHGDRYDRAHEVVEIVKGLWDSWDDDAFPQGQGDRNLL